MEKRYNNLFVTDVNFLEDLGCVCNRHGDLESGWGMYNVVFPKDTELIAKESYSLPYPAIYEPLPGLTVAGEGWLEYIIVSGMGFVLETYAETLETHIPFRTVSHLDLFCHWAEEIDARQLANS